MHTYLFLYALLVVVSSTTAKSHGLSGGDSPLRGLLHIHPNASIPAATPRGGYGVRGKSFFCAKNAKQFGLRTSFLNFLHHEKLWPGP